MAQRNQQPGILAQEREPHPDEQMHPGEGGESAADERAEGGANGQMQELFALVSSRVTDALAAAAEGLDTAMKADPYQAAVEFGTDAVREVANAAEEAGKQLPFEVLFAAGLQAIKDIAGIAVEKGYLAEDEIEVFLKEVLQQSIQRYTRSDMDDGKLSEDDFARVQQGMAGAAEGAI